MSLLEERTTNGSKKAQNERKFFISKELWFNSNIPLKF